LDPIRAWMYNNARLVGLLFLIAGTGMSIYLLAAYRSGSQIMSRTIWSAPGMLLYGLGIVIEPRLLTAWSPEGRYRVHGIFRVLSMILGAIIVGIVLYLQLVVFGTWREQTVGQP